MNILQVIPYFVWSYGGPVRVVSEISSELAKKGHNVTIYTTDVSKNTRANESEKLDLNNINICYFRCNNNKLADRLKLHTSHEMRTAIKRNISQFDLVHLHECRSIPNLYASYYCHKYNIPYVMQAHGACPIRIEGQSMGTMLIKIAFDSLVGKKALLNASKVIALTETEKEQYEIMGINEKKICIIPNGINLNDYEYDYNIDEFKKKHSIDTRDRLILYLGRLSKSKGIDLLIRAFSKIDSDINCKLLLIGPDENYRSELERLIGALGLKDNVIFTGFINDREKIMVLKSADIFITPNFSGFPVTFLEACACSTPIITTNKGDNLDWIHNNVGYVIDYDDVILKNTIMKLLCNDELRFKFGRQGEYIVKNQFNWRYIVEDIETVYYNIIKDRKVIHEDFY